MMFAYRRFGVATAYTVAIAIGGIIYSRVFASNLLPLVDSDGILSAPVLWLDSVVPIVLIAILVAVWGWVIAGSVQEERAIRRGRP